MAHAFWPFFDLTITTPLLVLRYANDDDLVTIARLAREGIHPPDKMPFLVPWSRGESPAMERNILQHHWLRRGETSPQHWGLPFVVVDNGEPVGVQAVHSEPGWPVARSVATGSWLVQRAQGRGIGREMRAAVLHLAFEGLRAVEAHTGGFEDNPASLAVTRALGYQPNGSQLHDREGRPARTLEFVMPRATWEQARRHDIRIDGLEPCLQLLGVE